MKHESALVHPAAGDSLSAQARPLSQEQGESNRSELPARPVAWMNANGVVHRDSGWFDRGQTLTPLYAAPPWPALRPFAIVKGRTPGNDDQIELAVHDGVNFTFCDGDCYERDGDTLDGYTAEFLTQYELEKRLAGEASSWIALTDEDRDRAFNTLPDMLDGFMKKWGWLHFAKAIEDICREKNARAAIERATS